MAVCTSQPFPSTWNYRVGLNRIFSFVLWAVSVAVSSSCTALHSLSPLMKSQLSFKAHLQCPGLGRASSSSSSPSCSPLDKGPADPWFTLWCTYLLKACLPPRLFVLRYTWTFWFLQGLIQGLSHMLVEWWREENQHFLIKVNVSVLELVLFRIYPSESPPEDDVRHSQES